MSSGTPWHTAASEGREVVGPVGSEEARRRWRGPWASICTHPHAGCRARRGAKFAPLFRNEHKLRRRSPFHHKRGFPLRSARWPSGYGVSSPAQHTSSSISSNNINRLVSGHLSREFRSGLLVEQSSWVRVPPSSISFCPRASCLVVVSREDVDGRRYFGRWGCSTSAGSATCAEILAGTEDTNLDHTFPLLRS